MKVFFLLLVSIALALADHHGHTHGDYVVKTHDDLVNYRNQCAEQVQAGTDLVDKYKQWQYPDDEKTRCYLKCVFEKFGFFDAQTGFDVHKVHEQLSGGHDEANHNDETHQKIENCADKNTQGSDACTWAYRAGMCFMSANLPLVKQSVKS